MCMSGEDERRSTCFQFLKEIQEKFLARYGDLGKTAIAFAMNEEFSRVIRSRMDHYNSGEGDKLGSLRSDLSETKNIMVQTMEKILERGEKIELLVEKTDRLNQQAFKFESNARSLKRNMWWRNCKMNIAIGLVILTVLFFLASSMCGGITFPQCRLSPGNNDDGDGGNNGRRLNQIDLKAFRDILYQSFSN